MPETLRRDLESYRLQAAQVEIARHRLVALDLLVFTAACSVSDRRRLCHAWTCISGSSTPPRPSRRSQTAAGDALKAIREGLPLAWLHQETEAEQFQAFLGLSDKDKLDLLAYCVATSLKPQLSTGHESTACELALSLTDASTGRLLASDAEQLSRPHHAATSCLPSAANCSASQWSQASSRDKKGELADALERAFAEPEKVACTPEQREKLKRWLPEGMAFGADDAAGLVAAGAEAS